MTKKNTHTHTHQDHLWQELALGVVLLHHLPVHHHELLKLLALLLEAPLDHRHEQPLAKTTDRQAEKVNTYIKKKF